MGSPFEDPQRERVELDPHIESETCERYLSGACRGSQRQCARRELLDLMGKSYT